MVTYISTRGAAPALDFEQVLLTGLARDGGLYLPAVWPQLSLDHVNRQAALSYQDAAFSIMQPFVGDAFGSDVLRRIIDEAYASFDDPAIAPVRKLARGDYLLELFHGPTFAFKDLALQILGHMMDHALARRDRRMTIIGATSGDTGGAAIEAFKGRKSVDIFMLHPHQRVSPVQRRQMTTTGASNVFNIAVEGTFDDCQSIVKRLFADLEFRDKHALGAVNSINWARVMAQIVYYFTSAAAVCPEKPVSFTVPTGNFGDIFAGYCAAQMGLPVQRLVIATNVNDILVRTLKSGRYQPRNVVSTASPSMDIQISSNFERLLFEATGRDSGAVAAMMQTLSTHGEFTLDEGVLEVIARQFAAGCADEEQTARTIAAIHASDDLLIDPHTAVGLFVAEHVGGSEGEPMITLATAHPAKFPQAVEQACGIAPDLPSRLAKQARAAEAFTVLDNSLEAVREFVDKQGHAT